MRKENAAKEKEQKEAARALEQIEAVSYSQGMFHFFALDLFLLCTDWGTYNFEKFLRAT